MTLFIYLMKDLKNYRRLGLTIYLCFLFLLLREYEALFKSGDYLRLDMSVRDEKEQQHIQNERVVCYLIVFIL
jgi:hypothetical protein